MHELCLAAFRHEADVAADDGRLEGLGYGAATAEGTAELAEASGVEEVAALRAELGQEDRAAGERHSGATEGEMRYRGSASPIPDMKNRTGALAMGCPCRSTKATS